jgi:hypothetical protein
MSSLEATTRLRDKPETRRISWWLTAALAPVGLLAGPFAIADLISGLIEWKGWIAFLIHYWDQNVSEPITRVLANLAETLALPRPPEFVSDYLTLGLIYAIGVARAHQLIEPYRIEREYLWQRTRIAIGKDAAPRSRRSNLIQLATLVAAPIFWPVLLMREFAELPKRLSNYAKDPDYERTRLSDRQLNAESPPEFYAMMRLFRVGGIINAFLTILPFLVALSLFVINIGLS